MPSPGATPVTGQDAMDLGGGLAATRYSDGGIVVWRINPPNDEVAYIEAGRQDPADLGDGRAASVRPDGSIDVFDINNPPPQYKGAPAAAPGAPARPGAPTGPVGTRRPGEDFNYGPTRPGVGVYPTIPGQTVRQGATGMGQTTSAGTWNPADRTQGRGEGWGSIGAGIEGIPYGWGVPGFGKDPIRIAPNDLSNLFNPNLAPGYLPGSGTYNQYSLAENPKTPGSSGLFGPIGPNQVISNTRYGLGGPGDPTTGGELQTPSRWITGNATDSTTALQGDARWRREHGMGGGGWDQSWAAAAPRYLPGPGVSAPPAVLAAPGYGMTRPDGTGGGGDAPPNALVGGDEYATQDEADALAQQNAQAAAASGDANRRAAALAWAQGKIGSREYNQLCQQFVENAYGTGFGTPSMGQFPSARAGAAALGATPDREASPGDLVYFNPDRSNGQFGHVGLVPQGGTPGDFVSATANGVRQDNYLTDPYWKRLYTGTAAPPEGWAGRAGNATGGGGGGMGGGGMGGGFFTAGPGVYGNFGQTQQTAGLDYLATLFMRSDTPTGISTAAWSAPRQFWDGLADAIRRGVVVVQDPQAWAMLAQAPGGGYTPQSIGGAALTGGNAQPGTGSTTEDAIANKNAADAADRAAYWAYQQSLLRQGDQRIALEEARDAWSKAYQTAGLTGQFGGADTMAMQQQKFAQGITEAGLTGTYQGQKTQQAIAQENAAAQALLSLQASLKGPRDWARYQTTFGSTPQGLQDVLAAFQGRYQLPGATGAPAQAQGGRSTVAGLAGDILSGTYGQDGQSGGQAAAMANPRQADLSNWARMQPSQREMILGQYENQGWYGPDVENLIKGAAPRNPGPSAASYNFFQS